MPGLLDDTLSDRQLRFVFEYLKDQNGAAAALRAGYAPGLRAQRANALMRNPAVLDRIRIELESLVHEAQSTLMPLARERARAAFFRPEQLLRAGWEPRAPGEMEEEERASLQVNVVLRRGGPTVNIRQPDRANALRALERLNERLEDSNQKYYDQVERAGGGPSLEELERIDAQAAGAGAGGQAQAAQQGE